MAKTLLSGMLGLGLVEASRRAAQVGLSIYRNPVGLTRTVMVAAAPVAQRPDSVSASETRRLHAVAVNYQALIADPYLAAPKQ
ncbi:MAG: hypothetical protein V2A79_06270 [Planctomycetota bacterium]